MVLAFIAVVLGLFLWPLMIGIGSFVLFIAIITLSITIAFYIIVLIGYMVRKAFGPKS